MLKSETLESKLIYIIGDSHALAFQNKMLTLPKNKINFLPKLLYIRGLSIENILNGQNLRTEINNFLLQSNLVAEHNLPASLSETRNILNEQYSSKKLILLRILKGIDNLLDVQFVLKETTSNFEL